MIDEIRKLEESEFDTDFVIFNGQIPVLLSSPHSIMQIHDDGTIKVSEPYTKAIVLYLNKHIKTYAIVNGVDTGLDPNRDNRDNYKKELLRTIRNNNIKLVLDIHGASESRDFDVEFGTLNNLSSDYSVVKNLEKTFNEHGITNIKYNDPFKGGAITQYVYGIDDVDVIQIEINKRFRNAESLDNLKKIIESLISFINNYKKYINR